MKLLRIAGPIAVTKGVFALAGSAMGLVSTATRGTAHLALSGVHLLAGLGDEAAARGQADSAAATDLTTIEPTEAEAAGGRRDEASERATVSVEPYPPEEPPVDVVGQALAAEEAAGDRAIPEGAGYAHEPRGASRDEEHGDVALPQSEADALAEEAAAALDEDVEPEEDHLTQPLIEPGEAAALAAEMRTARRGAERHKG